MRRVKKWWLTECRRPCCERERGDCRREWSWRFDWRTRDTVHRQTDWQWQDVRHTLPTSAPTQPRTPATLTHSCHCSCHSPTQCSLALSSGILHAVFETNSPRINTWPPCKTGRPLIAATLSFVPSLDKNCVPVMKRQSLRSWCLCLIIFLRYSASNNGVTLKF